MKVVMVMQSVGVAAGPWCSFGIKNTIYGCIIDLCIYNNINNHFFIFVATKDMFERVFLAYCNAARFVCLGRPTLFRRIVL